jgi:hypothetical protein
MTMSDQNEPVDARPRPSGPVTEAEIHQACDELNDAGREPKYDLVRQRLQNRGSWSTISRYIRTWVPQPIRRDAKLPDVLGSQAAALAETMWCMALRMSSTGLAAERQRFEERSAELRQALQDAEEDLGREQQRNGELGTAIDQLRSRSAELDEQLERAKAEVAELRSQLVAHQRVVKELAREMSSKARSQGEASEEARIANDYSGAADQADAA